MNKIQVNAEQRAFGAHVHLVLHNSLKGNDRLWCTLHYRGPLTGYFPCTLYLEYCSSMHSDLLWNSKSDDLLHHSLTISPFLSNFRPGVSNGLIRLFALIIFYVKLQRGEHL